MKDTKESLGKMKVLIIAFGHPDNVFSLAYHLSDKVDLTVLFVLPGNHYRQGILDIDLTPLNLGINFNRKKMEEVLPVELNNFINDKFKLGILKTYDNKLFKDKYLRNLRLLVKNISHLNKEGFDVIHINGVSGFIYYFYLFLNGKNIFWTLHDYKPHTGEGRILTKARNRFISNRKRIKLIQHYKYLKNAVKEEFNLSSDKVIQIYSGPFTVYKAFHPKKLLEIDDYVLFFGRISKYKGLDKLLKVYHSIDKPKKKLVVAGAGNFWFDINIYKNDNVFIVNRYIQTNELISLIENASFVVVPYTDATHSAVVATAYTFNKPVLASNVDGLNEVVQHGTTGYLFNISKNDDFKSYLELMMKEKHILKYMTGNISKGIPKDLSWANIVKEYYTAYTNNS